MCETDSLPFKPGDRIRGKGLARPTPFKVTAIGKDRAGKVQFVVEDEDDGWWCIIRNHAEWELVPDPMVARREAYIAYMKAQCASEYDLSYLNGIRSGFSDYSVNKCYDAIVATKHLFT